MERIITCDEAINEITDFLIEASGEWIAEIYTQLSGNKKATYEGDSFISITAEE